MNTDATGVGPVQNVNPTDNNPPKPKPDVDLNEPGHPHAPVPPVPPGPDGKPVEGQMPAEADDVKPVDEQLDDSQREGEPKVDATTHPAE